MGWGAGWVGASSTVPLGKDTMELEKNSVHSIKRDRKFKIKQCHRKVGTKEMIQPNFILNCGQNITHNIQFTILTNSTSLELLILQNQNLFTEQPPFLSSQSLATTTQLCF